MSTILGFFFFIILIILIIGFSLISGVLKLLFGSGRRSETNRQQQESHRQSGRRTENRSQATSRPSPNRKKIFGDDEGEYVDFEEVKEDK